MFTNKELSLIKECIEREIKQNKFLIEVYKTPRIELQLDQATKILLANEVNKHETRINELTNIINQLG